MHVYTRYFKVTDGPLIEAVEECRAFNEDGDKLLQSLGANEEYYVQKGKAVGLIFPETPDPKLYKRAKNTPNGRYPKQNSKAGKAIAKALESLKTKDVDDCLASVGLQAGLHIVIGGHVYAAKLVVIPSDPLIVLAIVPWYDEDPEKLEKYKKDREAGIYIDMTLDALLWEPTAEMVEISMQECKKVIREWNDSLNT